MAASGAVVRHGRRFFSGRAPAVGRRRAVRQVVGARERAGDRRRRGRVVRAGARGAAAQRRVPVAVQRRHEAHTGVLLAQLQLQKSRDLTLARRTCARRSTHTRRDAVRLGNGAPIDAGPSRERRIASQAALESRLGQIKAIQTRPRVYF